MLRLSYLQVHRLGSARQEERPLQEVLAVLALQEQALQELCPLAALQEQAPQQLKDHRPILQVLGRFLLMFQVVEHNAILVVYHTF